MQQDPPLPLSYVRHPVDDALHRPPKSDRFLIMILGIVVGMLGANSFADAVGLPDPRFLPSYNNEGPIVGRVVCGFVVMLLAIGSLIFLARIIRHAIADLAQVTAKPRPPMPLTLVGCGTLCLLGALIFEWYLASYVAPANAAATLVNKMIQGDPGASAATLSIHAQSSPVAQVVAIFTFLAGIAMIAIGIWSSLNAPPASPISALPSSIPLAPTPPPL